MRLSRAQWPDGGAVYVRRVVIWVLCHNEESLGDTWLGEYSLRAVQYHSSRAWLRGAPLPVSL